MSVKKRLIGLLILFTAIVGVTNLGSFGVLAKSSFETQPMETVKSVEVELDDDYFKPNVITIPNKETTTLILKNVGKKEHTFTVEKLGIDVDVQPGKEKTITVKPTTPGTYELICRYHVKEGMVGKVVVK